MASRYVIDVYDRAGRYSQTSATDWGHAVSVAEMMARHYPSKVVRGFNLEQVDLGFDGLTEEQRDEIDAAVMRGRTSA